MDEALKEAREAGARAGREAIREYQRLNPGDNGAQSSLEWEEMREVYQRPFRMIANGGIDAFLSALRERGYKIVGREPVPEMVKACGEMARKLNPAMKGDNFKSVAIDGLSIYRAMWDVAPTP